MGVSNERGGGHTVGAREGQQWGQGPRPCSREGAGRGWPTNTFAWGRTLSALYYDYTPPSDMSVVLNAFLWLTISCSFPKLFAIKSRSCPKLDPIFHVLVPKFLGRGTQNFWPIFSNCTLLACGKVWWQSGEGPPRLRMEKKKVMTTAKYNTSDAPVGGWSHNNNVNWVIVTVSVCYAGCNVF